MKGLFMRTSHRTLLVAISVFIVCSIQQSATAQSFAAETHPLTPARAATVQRDVRAFASAVAHDVTQSGPAAWRKYFADTRSFFMAVDGNLVYANGAAAIADIPNLERSIKHIELRWGDDLHIDPLTPDFAVVAASWHEVITDATGKRTDVGGYFTGTAEPHDGRWQFRNAHWSVVHAAPAP
jgi:hypothetical protein